MATCSHRHTILATAAVAAHEPEGRPVPVTLYHWSPPSVRALLTIVMSPDSFSAVKGFTPLGVFRATEYLNLSRPLSQRLLEMTMTNLPENNGHGAGELDPTPQLLADLLLVAQQQVPSGGDDGRGELLRFFSFPVLSHSPVGVLSDGPRARWMWSKPGSVYDRKAGRWGADLAKVLEDGEWSAGRGLALLVKGVADEAGGAFLDL